MSKANEGQPERVRTLEEIRRDRPPVGQPTGTGQRRPA